jgi:hypothetical protein
MILLIILGIASYFLLPLLIVMWLLEKNDYMIFGWSANVPLVGWGFVLVEFAFFVQILSWTGFF